MLEILTFASFNSTDHAHSEALTNLFGIYPACGYALNASARSGFFASQFFPTATFPQYPN